MLFCDNIMLSKRDAPSLHLDFFHTRNEHTARFLFYDKNQEIQIGKTILNQIEKLN